MLERESERVRERERECVCLQESKAALRNLLLPEREREIES